MDDHDSTLKFEHPKWKSNLVENLTVLFKKGELCDLYIMCQDHRDLDVAFACHACILASASPVIRKLLTKNDIFAAWTKLALKSYGISSTDWQYILKYVYTGSVNIKEPDIYNVWKAALYLQIDILVTVLATCVHKYHYPAKEMDRLPHLKVRPFDPSCLKNSRSFQSSEIIHDKPDNVHLVQPSHFDSSGHKRDEKLSYKSDSYTSENDCLVQNRIQGYQKICPMPLQYTSHSQVSSEISNEPINLTEEGSPGNSSIKESKLIKSLLMKDTYSPPFSSAKLSDSNCRPSAIKKRKMYTPRRVQANEKQNKVCDKSHAEEFQQRSYSIMQGKHSQPTIELDIVSDQKYITISPMGDYSPETSLDMSRPNNAVDREKEFKSHRPVVIAPYESDNDSKSLYDVYNEPQRSLCRDGEEGTRYHIDADRNSRLGSPKPGNKFETSVLYGLLHPTSQTPDSQEESSVLKSLLVSNCNNYRSPDKPEHAMKTLIPKTEPEQYFRDSSTEEDEDYNYIIDLKSVNNKKNDPDYKPSNSAATPPISSKVKRKLEQGFSKQNRKKEKYPLNNPDSPSRGQPTKPKHEPYSASSILLSMIKDAGAKKPNPSPDPVSLSLAAILKSKPEQLHRTVQADDIDQHHLVSEKPLTAEVVPFMSTPKGILRNLLKEKGICSGEEKSNDSNENVMPCSSPSRGLGQQATTDDFIPSMKPTDLATVPPDVRKPIDLATVPSSVMKPTSVPPLPLSSDKKSLEAVNLAQILPFSNVLQNLALAYNFATRSPHETSLLKHMLDNGQEKPTYENIGNRTLSAENGACFENQTESSSKNRSHVESQMEFSNDFKVKEESVSPKFYESMDQEQSDSEHSRRCVLNVPSMIGQNPENDQNYGNDQNLENNQIKNHRNILNRVTEEQHQSHHESGYREVNSPRNLQVMEGNSLRITNVQSLRNPEFETLKDSGDYPESCKSSSSEENMNESETEFTALNLSVKNKIVQDLINSERAVGGNVDGSESSDVEVALFSGLQTVDSSASVSDTEVA